MADLKLRSPALQDLPSNAGRWVGRGYPYLLIGVSGMIGCPLCSVCSETSPGPSHRLATTPPPGIHLPFELRMLPG
jgi:hypothetical protein